MTEASFQTTGKERNRSGALAKKNDTIALKKLELKEAGTTYSLRRGERGAMLAVATVAAAAAAVAAADILEETYGASVISSLVGFRGGFRWIRKRRRRQAVSCGSRV